MRFVTVNHSCSFKSVRWDACQAELNESNVECTSRVFSFNSLAIKSDRTQISVVLIALFPLRAERKERARWFF